MSRTKDLEGIISAKEAADLLGLESERRIQQLAADGWIHKNGHGQYFLRSVVQGYVAFLKKENERNSQSSAQARVSDARAKDYEIRNAKADHTLIELSEADAVLDEISSMIRLGMEGVPAAVTRDLTLRRKIEAAIDDVFAKTAARIAETLEALGASGEALDADSEDDA